MLKLDSRPIAAGVLDTDIPSAQPTSQPARTPAACAPPPAHAFVTTMRRLAAGEDAGAVKAERLAVWNELGERVASLGWQHLERVLAAAESSDFYARHVASGDSHEPIEGDEAEALAERFVRDCRRVVASGGAVPLWFILVGDLSDAGHALADSVCSEYLEKGDAGEISLLVDTARCYALTAFASRYADREAARVLFGPPPRSGTARLLVESYLDTMAPFAIDNGDGESAVERLRRTAEMFATARTPARVLEATRAYAYGCESQVRENLTPIQRIGLVAWLARRGLSMPTQAATAAPRARKSVRRNARLTATLRHARRKGPKSRTSNVASKAVAS